jgi:hypothetical protein
MHGFRMRMFVVVTLMIMRMFVMMLVMMLMGVVMLVVSMMMLMRIAPAIFTHI